MNINECGCRPYGWLGLDGNRCIRVIPRQRQRLFWVLKLPLPYEQLIMQLAVNYALAYVKTHTWYQRNIVDVKEKLTLSQLLVFLVNGP